MKRSVTDLNLKGKRVFLRADFNVPVNGKKITDDTRIKEELENLNYILGKGASVVLASHLGRPDGVRSEKDSLMPVFEYLKKIYGSKIKFIEDFKTKEGKKEIKNLKVGEIALLENIRFYKEEEENDKGFSKKLASLADVYVNDAFGTAHRQHASTHGVARFLKENAVGLLVNKELEMISERIDNPKHPFVVILGGSKVKDKIKMIKNLLEKADTLLIGGGLAYTFLVAEGKKVGNSIVDDTNIEFAKQVIKLAKEKGKKILLPIDHICAEKIDSTKVQTTTNENVKAGMAAFDIGPKTAQAFAKEIKGAGLIVWNGPLGAYEYKQFSTGTATVAKAVASAKGESIIGGGDVVSAITGLKLEKKMTHISTGGGASLNLMEGVGLSALEVIKEKK